MSAPVADSVRGIGLAEVEAPFSWPAVVAYLVVTFVLIGCAGAALGGLWVGGFWVRRWEWFSVGLIAALLTVVRGVLVHREGLALLARRWAGPLRAGAAAAGVDFAVLAAGVMGLALFAPSLPSLRGPGLLVVLLLWAAVLCVPAASCGWLTCVKREMVRRGLAMDAGRCAACEYDLAGLPPGAACPECGRRGDQS